MSFATNLPAVRTRDDDRSVPHVVATVSAVTARQSFAAAGNQFAALTLLGSRPPIPASAAAPAAHASQAQPLSADGFIRDGIIHLHPDGRFAGVVEYLRAVAAIDAKAAAMGFAAQSNTVDVTSVPGGYVGRYPSADIYTDGAPGAKAFEVHGEIRAKYVALGGAAGLLGLPVTDELGAPDGVGRYNHFQTGSIYWTPRTGPMAVHGTVRDRWAASGWERGPLGYPVQDQHRMILEVPQPSPLDNRESAKPPVVEWCSFENGIIAGDLQSALPVPHALQTPQETLGRIAEPALLTYAGLGALVGKLFNDQFVASPDNAGLRPGVELTGVSDWQYGFWASTPRSVGFRLHGFHDNGYAPDTNFVIDVRLRFELVWSPGFTEPPLKTLVAVLDQLNVGHDGGLALARVYAKVESAIIHAFYRSDPNVPVDSNHPEVPSGARFVADVPTGAQVATIHIPATKATPATAGHPATTGTPAVDTTAGYIDVLDVMVTAAGDLQVLVNPLAPPGSAPSPADWAYLRQQQAQIALDEIAQP